MALSTLRSVALVVVEPFSWTVLAAHLPVVVSVVGAEQIAFAESWHFALAVVLAVELVAVLAVVISRERIPSCFATASVLDCFDADAVVAS